MSKIKICGLFRPEDIAAVNRAKPDYAGFVFAPSRRQVSPDRAARLIAQLDPAILPVGVFVNESPATAARIAARAGMRVIQLHGEEDAAYLTQLRSLTDCEVWKAVRVKDADSLSTMEGLNVERFLLDAYVQGEYGGCGESFRWELLNGLGRRDFILAGGLHEGNLGEALRTVRPYCVDLSSGAETKGLKDARKIEALVSIARSFC